MSEWKQVVIYQVTYTSLDNGHRCVWSMHKHEAAAYRKANTLGSALEPKVFKHEVLLSPSGDYYEIPTRILNVNQPPTHSEVE